MWKELWGIPAIAVRYFVCAWAGEGKAWQAPGCTATHKFRRDCSSFGLLLVSHLQWEHSSPVTGSWKTLTAGARWHQADGLLLAKAAACRGMLETSRTISAFSQKMFPVPRESWVTVRCCWRLPLACFLTGRCWFSLRLPLNPYKQEPVTAEEQSGERRVTGELPCAPCLTLCLLPAPPAKHNIPFSSM